MNRLQFNQFDIGDATSNFDFQFADTTTTTWTLPDPLIDWLPYKWKKYIPTWHLVKSYSKHICS